MTKKVVSTFLVLSCTADGGACIYRLHEDGTMEPTTFIPMPSPMYAQKEGNRLWVALRSPFEDKLDSSVTAFDITTGEMLTDPVSTQGVVACHLCADGEDVYCANYVTGSVFRAPDTVVSHEGSGPDPVRQTTPHVHGTFFSPDKAYVLVCDLGTDSIVVYDRSLKEVSRASVPPGSGARHLCFSADGRYVYCINEMSATLSIFEWNAGTLTFLSDTSIAPEGYTGQGKGSAIKLSADGHRLYLTERGSETIAVYAIEGADIRRVDEVSSHGTEPRDIALLAEDTFLVCANQFSNELTLYALDAEGRMQYLRSYTLPAPICVIELS